MITGQFKDQILTNHQWNSKINPILEAKHPEYLKNKFTDNIDNTPINSLNLTKIYILTSKSSASASELVINGLRPYMNVIQIGDVTYGKNVGSITLYDSKSFGNQNRNPNHKYAMQPIVFKSSNSAGYGDYSKGLTPTHELIEDMENLGILGNNAEPLLSTAIGEITRTAKMIKQSPEKDFKHFKDAKSLNSIQNQMYINKLPETILKTLE
jgi:carboxyl-terminal processing protease